MPYGEDVLKTKASVRTLPLLPVIEELLLAEKDKQETFRRLFKKEYCKKYLDYICVDQMGNLLRPNFVTEHFSYMISKYNLKKIRFHDLRHTCASLLLANGVSMKQIQIWLGHSNFSTTADIYAHLDVSAQMGTGDVAGAFYAKPDRKPCEQSNPQMDSDAEGEPSTADQAEESMDHKTRQASKPSVMPNKPDSTSQTKGKGSAARTAKKGVETCTKKTSSVSSSPKKGTAKCRKPIKPEKV